MADVVEGVALLLAAEGVGAWNPNGDYDDTQPAILHMVVPHKLSRVVILSLYPGPELGGEDSRNGWTTPRLQVRTRAGEDPRAALDLDLAVRDVLHGLSHTTLPNGVRLTDCHSLQTAPMPLGMDTNGRWEFTRNYQLTIN